MTLATMTLASMVFATLAASIALHAAAADDLRVTLVKNLGLVEAQRDSLSTTAAGRSPEIKACVTAKATDARLSADLAEAIRPSVPTDESVRPLLRFADTPAGKKFSTGIRRRNRIGTAGLTGPGLRPMIFAGVVMYAGELTPAEADDIGNFLTSDEGKPLASILKETSGFAQLARTLKQMNAFTAECGIDTKPAPR
jgi:hypothetical protein